MIVDLNTIEPLSSSQFRFTWKNCDLNSCSDVVTSNLNYSTTLTPRTSIGFLKVYLPPLGRTFNDLALKTDAVITCSESNAVNCFNTNKIIGCNNNFFWVTNAGAQSCSATCANAYPRYLYTKTSTGFQVNKASENSNTGYCTGECHASTPGKIKCPTEAQFSDSSYTSLTCNGTNYSRFSFFCLQNDYTYMGIANEPNAGSLFYSQGFNSRTIEIGAGSLTEYHFEMWFLPDLIFLPKYSTNNAGDKFYVLWTDSIRIKKDTKNFSSTPAFNDYKVYNGNDATAIVPTNSQVVEMNHGQWFKISYSVIKNGSNWDFYLYYKNSSDIGYKKTGLTSSPSLSKIAFCTNNCNNFFTDGLWYSGAYKLLKVWDATLMPRDIYLEMDR